MEGFSTISYKGKKIMYVDYTTVGYSKEKVIQLVRIWEEEIIKNPPKSLLTMVNLGNLRFDSELQNILKNASAKTDPYVKKAALFGLKPIHQALFNFGFAISFKNTMKVFNTEEEAKEWLVSD